jgi:hypothetical protein
VATHYGVGVTIEINGQSIKAFEEGLAQALDKIPNRLKTIDVEYREVEPTPEAKLLDFLSSGKAKRVALTIEEARAWLEDEQSQNPT